MSDSNRNKGFAVGLVAGLGIALLFLVWAVPEFRSPEYAKDYYQSYSNQTASDSENLIPSGISAYVTPVDTLAQWVMAAFTVILTFVTGLAVWYVYKAAESTAEILVETKKATDAAQDTVKVTRQIGHAEARGYFRPVSVKLMFSNGNFIHQKSTGKYITWVTPDFEILGNTPIRGLKIAGRISVQKHGVSTVETGIFTDEPYTIQLIYSGDNPPSNKVFSIESPVANLNERDILSVQIVAEYSDVFDNVWENSSTYRSFGGFEHILNDSLTIKVSPSFTREIEKAAS